MDTNPNANMGLGQPQLTQQQPVTATNGVASMIKAMLAGNDQYKAGQAGAGGGMPPSPMSSGSMVPGAAGPSSTGGAMGPAPLVDPNSLQGGLGGPAPMGPPPPGAGGGMPPPTMGASQYGSPMYGGGGASGTGIPQPSMPMSQGFPNSPQGPMSMDPVTNALMSPIPGMTNG